MNWLRRQMMGRYGRLDQLNIFLLIAVFLLALVRTILNLIFHFTVVGLFNPISGHIASAFYSVLFGLQIAGIIILFLRIMSRDTAKRARENQQFLNRFYNIKDWGDFRKKKKEANRDGKTLYKCPVCRKVIRVPLGKGRIEITCPNCKNRFVKKT